MEETYYNEFDPEKAEWLLQLIDMGLIPPGDVDERSIIDVRADEIRHYTQHHFFAGIGVWPYALRNAGWPDDEPVATASLPCQPFSSIGKHLGTQDERHLLPAFCDLVSQLGFITIFGEQVEQAIAQNWLDDLHTALGQEAYTIGHAVLGAHSAGAYHIRQRLIWVAHKGGLGNASSQRLEGHPRHGHAHHRQKWQATHSPRPIATPGDEVDWIKCTDNRLRPVKPGIIPLVDGASARVGCGCNPSDLRNADNTGEARKMRLTGYGDAIQAQTVQLFIEAFIECMQEQIA